MMRILEPEVMDTARDAAEYDAMDFSESDTRFAEDALALVAGRPGAELLDIGTGTAKIPVIMLDRRADLQVLAIDLSNEMLHVATRNVAKAGHGSACRLAKHDAKALRLSEKRYDLVMSNSVTHHIPDPIVHFQEIARVVRSDGAVLIRDLLRPATMDDAWGIVKRVAAGEHIRQQQLFFDSLCAALTLSEVEDLVSRAGLGRMRVAKISDRHWTAERSAFRARAG
ncbi:MAG: methyltransferase domain-containing protein [Minicystis sp.]